MPTIRTIRADEIELIHFLLSKINLNPQDHPLPDLVDAYEGGKMGSIGLLLDRHEYDGDLIRAEYFDEDDILVVITLTKDKSGKLLDLDFWKTDFSKLLAYPTPDQLLFNQWSQI